MSIGTRIGFSTARVSGHVALLVSGWLRAGRTSAAGAAGFGNVLHGGGVESLACRRPTSSRAARTLFPGARQANRVAHMRRHVHTGSRGDGHAVLVSAVGKGVIAGAAVEAPSHSRRLGCAFGRCRIRIAALMVAVSGAARLISRPRLFRGTSRRPGLRQRAKRECQHKNKP